MLRSTRESCAQKRQDEALTVERLKEVLHYDSETGVFTWLKTNSNRAKAGGQAGGKSHGYLKIGIDGRRYYAHHLAWFYMTGEWPVGEIDHRDTNGENNRWKNLRPATRAEQVRNTRVSRNNKLGIKGVCLESKSGKYLAQLMVNRQQVLREVFETPEQAAAAYARAAEKHHGDFARVA